MAARQNPAQLLQRKMTLLHGALAGREAASSSSLAASFGLAVEDVRKILKTKGVHDEG